MDPKQLDRLTRLHVRDLLTAYKLQRWERVLGPLARVPARRVSMDAARFDDLVGTEGLVSGGRFLLAKYAGPTTVLGAERLPPEGPLLVASNHPGMMDAMAVWVALGREDLRILAAERDLLDLLPHIRSRLILIREGETRALRDSLAWLRNGGAILTFPAGRIEPDPTVRPGAVESLAGWSESVAAMAGRVAGTRLVPAAVRGVIHPGSVRHPLLRLFRDPKERDWAAATLQILVARYRRPPVTVAFGEPIEPSGGEEQASLMGRLRSAMEGLLQATG